MSHETYVTNAKDFQDKSTIDRQHHGDAKDDSEEVFRDTKWSASGIDLLNVNRLDFKELNLTFSQEFDYLSLSKSWHFERFGMSTIRRKRAHSLISRVSGEGRNVVKSVVGSERKVLDLPTFLRQYAPCLDADAVLQDILTSKTSGTSGSRNANEKLLQTMVVPLDSCHPLKSVRVPVRNEQSFSSLVDDAVWTLLKRREKRRRYAAAKNGVGDVAAMAACRNLLCQGYAFGGDLGTVNDSSTNGTPSMPLGAVMTHINNNIDYFKTSIMFQRFHSLVGDDVMRMLLIHTAIFVPTNVLSSSTRGKGNYMQLTGPLLYSRVLGTDSKTKSLKRQRKSRKKPERHFNLQGLESIFFTNDGGSTMIIPKELQPLGVLSKKNLLYSDTFVPKVGLPTSHILNQQGCSAETLLTAMLNPTIDSTGTVRKAVRKPKQSKRWQKLLSSGVPLCESFLRGHKSCDYARLLERCCPLPAFCQNLKSKDTDVSVALEEVGKHHSPADNVISFVRSVLRKIIPPEFFGTKENMDHILRHLVDVFVKLRRQEHLGNKNLLHGIRLSKIGWLYYEKKGKRSRSDHKSAELLLLRLLRWILGQFVTPLLSATFHATDSEFSGKQILFYRKPVWTIFSALSMKKLLKSQYREISEADAMTKLQQQQMGFSRLRLLPKSTGVRPIATLCKRVDTQLLASHKQVLEVEAEDDEDVDTPFGPARKKQKVILDSSNVSKVYSGQFLSTNRILNDAFSVLQEEYNRSEELFGAGVHGLHYLYPRYRRFIGQLKANRKGPFTLHIGSVDIRHCYDNIDQHRLLKVINDLLSEDEYLIQRYDVFHPFESMGRTFKRPRKMIGPPSDFRPFYQVAENLGEHHHRSIFVDGVRCTLVKKDRLMGQLREHLTSHLVTVRGRYGDRYLLQSTGIPQGSVLSTLLCNFYYGNVERMLLPGHFASDRASVATGNDSMLVRMVDDFMLMTTEQPVLEDFLHTMYRGNPTLGVSINPEKTQVSLPVELKENNHLSTHFRLQNSTMDDFFPWCGMLFHIHSGEVRIDYDRFIDGKGGDTLTVERLAKEGDRFAVAMKVFVRPRCIPILFDRLINGPKTQMINFYQLMALGAVKTVEYLRSSDIMRTLESNIGFVVDAMDSTISYAFNLIDERLKSHHSELSPCFPRSVAFWLGWTAYLDVIKLVPEVRTLNGDVRKKLAKWDVEPHVRFTAVTARESMNIARLFNHGST